MIYDPTGSALWASNREAVAKRANDLITSGKALRRWQAIPRAGCPLGDTQHVVYRGDDGHLHELYWESAGGWSHNDLTNASGGASAVAGDPAGYVLGDTQHVVYRGADGHLHELYWESAGGWSHNDLTNASGGAPAVAGDPAGYVLGDTQHGLSRC